MQDAQPHRRHRWRGFPEVVPWPPYPADSQKILAYGPSVPRIPCLMQIETCLGDYSSTDGLRETSLNSSCRFPLLAASSRNYHSVADSYERIGGSKGKDTKKARTICTGEKNDIRTKAGQNLTFPRLFSAARRGKTLLWAGALCDKM